MFRSAGERNDNHGSGHQGIVVEIPCQKQSTSGAVRATEDTSLSRLRILVEAGVITWRVAVNVRQKLEAPFEP